MRPARSRLISALVLCGATLISLAPAHADPVYSIDILSSEFYPQLQDSSLLRINNRGVAAGYIATESADGPYLPTTYSGGGRFNTLGIQSSRSQSIVTGLNDRGDVVGNSTDASGVRIPYIFQTGTVSFPSFPSNLSPIGILGINNSGLAYGVALDTNEMLGKVFTVSNGSMEVLPLSAPGLVSFGSNSFRLNDAGILGVTGASEDGTRDAQLLYDLATSRLTPLAIPIGFDRVLPLNQVTASFAFGTVATADFSQTRLGLWNLDGSFRSFFDAPEGTSNLNFNNLGQAIGLNDGRVLFYDGSLWSERPVTGLDGYTISRISDFNDRGDFVGVVRDPRGTSRWGYRALAVPEPASLVLMAGGLLTVAFANAARRRTRVSAWSARIGG